MTFEAAMVLTRTIGSHTSFEDEECRAYFDLLMTLPANSLIVEVGLEYGRSSSIALQVCAAKNFNHVGIDPFDDPTILDKWIEMSLNCGRDCSGSLVGLMRSTCKRLRSDDFFITDPINAILIDGDHSYEGVLADCEHFLPHVVPGGYAMFHDYSRESLPEVTQAVNDYLAPRPEWSQIGVYGTLGIWRRIL